MQEILTNAWAQGGAVLIGLISAVWMGWKIYQDGNRREKYIMGAWTDKLNEIHEDVHDRGDRADENQITTSMMIVGVQEQLTGIIGRSYRIDKREGGEDAPREWMDAHQQLERYNKTSDRLIVYLNDLHNQRKQDAQKRELRALEKKALISP